MSDDQALDLFEQHRPLLFGVAYRMLGRVMDAEDVLQEAWLRWSAVDLANVREPRGYLVRTVSRLALDRLRRQRARRESYVGPWLPEPLPTDFGNTVPDTVERALLADSVSLAVLVVLESLSPLERAVFVLREAFGFPYDEIATILDRGQPAVRQLAARARRHVEERRPRFEVDPTHQRVLTERFLAAATRGDLDGLVSVLATDVRLVGDSGGKAKAPPRILRGADKVSRFLAAVGPTSVPGLELSFPELNSTPAILATSEGSPVAACLVDVVDGRIQCVYIMVNPEKLAHLTSAPVPPDRGAS